MRDMKFIIVLVLTLVGVSAHAQGTVATPLEAAVGEPLTASRVNQRLKAGPLARLDADMRVDKELRQGAAQPAAKPAGPSTDEVGRILAQRRLDADRDRVKKAAAIAD